MKHLHISGAGLTGSLAASAFHNQAETLTLSEKRPDPRQSGAAGGRSINLALSKRGLRALDMLGLAADVLAEAIPMRGRMIHDPKGETSLQPYGHRDEEVIYAVSRSKLNQRLLDAATSTGAGIQFETPATGFDPATGELHLAPAGRGPTTFRPDQLLVTEGANSAIRDALMRRTRLNFTQEFLEHGYKELTIPPGPGGEHQLDPNALHIWPRKRFMMIALPNVDGSFTCTLFLAFAGEPGFDQLTSAEDVRRFFDTHFPDAVPRMPDLQEEFFANPTSWLITLRTWPWTHGNAMLLGDAAHAIVPFYGQGMNACFEDVRLLSETLAACGGDWAKACPRFAERRKPDADAIATLAMDNFIEMRDHTADPVFARKRELELRLEEAYPEAFFSKYRLVTFTHTPYAEALRRGREQDAVLMQVAAETKDPEALSLSEVLQRIRESVPEPTSTG